MTLPILTGIWILISVLGLAYALWDMASAYGHYNLVKQGWPDHGRLLEFTRMTLTAQSSRALLLIFFLVIGINAFTARNSTLFVFSMFAANAVTVLTAIRSHYYRESLFRQEQKKIRQEQREDPTP